MQSEASAEDSIISYRSVKEETDTNTQGDLVDTPDTLLWIKSIVDETIITTDDDCEAKEPSKKGTQLKSRGDPAEPGVRRRPRFTAPEEFVLVRELLDHHDLLFGARARITPFTQKVWIWRNVLEKVKSVGVVQRGVEEAKRHWQRYIHRLRRKLEAMQRQTVPPAAPQSLLARLTPLETKAANVFRLDYVVRSSSHLTPHGAGVQSAAAPAGDTAGLYAQNGAEQGGSSLALADYSLSKAPRNIKFSFDENCALVHEAVGVWDSIIGRNSASTSQARKNFLWSRIVEAVNAAGSQPRSADNCKKRLRDIKRRVKAKMADQRKYSQQNGGAPCLELQYLSYEEELIHVMGHETVRPIEGNVDTDREPRKYDEEENCYEEDFWNCSSFDLAEEEEEDDKELVIKMEPIDYSMDGALPSQCLPAATPPLSVAPVLSVAPPLPGAPVLSVAPPLSVAPVLSVAPPLPGAPPSQLQISSAKPNRPPIISAKPIPTVGTKPLPVGTKPPPTKPNAMSSSAPSTQPSTANVGAINKVMGTLHTAQRHHHRSQRHQMHVLHMDLLHLGQSVQHLTRNVKVNNHIRSTERTKELRLKQKDSEDQRLYRMEKLCLLRQHHEAKLRARQEHYEKKEKLLEENNHLLRGILQRLSHPAETIPTEEHNAAQIMAPSPPPTDHRHTGD